MTAWAAVYVLAGETRPAIWLVPCLCGFAGAIALGALGGSVDGRRTP